jgi:hypothetical protein
MLPHPPRLTARLSYAYEAPAPSSWSRRSEPVFGANARDQQVVDRLRAQALPSARGGETARALEGIRASAVDLSAPLDVEMLDLNTSTAAPGAASRGGRVSKLAQERLARREERPYGARRRLTFQGVPEFQPTPRLMHFAGCPGPWHRFAQEAAEQLGGDRWGALVRCHQALPLLQALAEASSDTLQQASDDFFLMSWMANTLHAELRLYREEAVPSVYRNYRAQVQQALDTLALQPSAQTLYTSLQKKLLGVLTNPVQAELVEQNSSRDELTESEQEASTGASREGGPTASESLATSLSQLRL